MVIVIYYEDTDDTMLLNHSNEELSIFGTVRTSMSTAQLSMWPIRKFDIFRIKKKYELFPS